MERKRGEKNQIFSKREEANWVKEGCLKRGDWNPLTKTPSVFTLYFKFLWCFKIYQIARATFSSQILMYSLKSLHPHPLNSQNLLSMTTIFCCCTLLNYKNKSSTNASKYYRLAIYLGNTKHFCGNSILQFFKAAEFLENIQYKCIWQGIQLSDL